MTLPRLIQGPRRWLFLALLAAGAVEASAAVVTARAVGEAARMSAPQVAHLATLLLGFGVMGLTAFAGRWIGERLAQSLVGDIRRRLFERSLRAVGSVEESRLLTPFVGELTAVRNWAARGPAAMMVSGVALVGSSGLLAIRYSELAICLAPFAVGLGLIAGLAPPLDNAVAAQRRARGAITRFVMVRLRRASERIPGRTPGRTRRRVRRSDREGLDGRGARFAAASIRRAQLIGASDALAIAAGGAATVVLLAVVTPAGAGDALIPGLTLLGFLSTRLMEFNRGAQALISGRVALRTLRARLRPISRPTASPATSEPETPE